MAKKSKKSSTGARAGQRPIKILQMGVLADLIDEYANAMENKPLESFDGNGNLTPVANQTRDDAVKALRDAFSSVNRICQQAVLGVKVK